MKTKLLSLLGGLLAIFGLNSCLQNESTLRLNKDGSGTIVEETVMGAQMVAMMDQMGAAGGEAGAGAPNPFEEMYDEAKYKETAANYGEGVTFASLEKIERDGGKGVKVTYNFADINNVSFSPGSSLKNMNKAGVEEAEQKEEPLTFTYADGKLTINFPDPKKPEGAEDSELPDEDDPNMAMAVAMMKDMRVSAHLVIEPGIEETNATHVKDDTITLMDVRFGELLANEGGMKVMKKLETDDRATLAEAVKGMKGIEMETQETVTVELK